MQDYKGYRAGNRPSIAQTAYALNDKIKDVIQRLGLRGNTVGHEFVAYNPTRPDKNLGSFRICIKGSKCGGWYEHKAGEGGDSISLIAYCLGIGQKEACEKYAWPILGWSVDSFPDALPQVKYRKDYFDDKEDEAFIKKKKEDGIKARNMFIHAQENIIGTPVDLYLQARGIFLSDIKRQPRAIRFHPEFAHYHPETKEKTIWPAMLSLIQDVDGSPRALHATYLSKICDVWKKAPIEANKKMFFSMKGGFIPICRGASGVSMKEAVSDSSVFIAEGIETSLSLACCFPEERIIAACSSGNFKNIKLPDAIKTVYLCMDNDGDGAQAARSYQKAAYSFACQGKRVMKMKPPEQYNDFNDWLIAIRSGESSFSFDGKAGKGGSNA